MPALWHGLTLRPGDPGGTPKVSLPRCSIEQRGCGRPFAVEIRVTVQVEVSTCRLALPSTTPPDALADPLLSQEPEIFF